MKQNERTISQRARRKSRGFLTPALVLHGVENANRITPEIRLEVEMGPERTDLGITKKIHTGDTNMTKILPTKRLTLIVLMLLASMLVATAVYASAPLQGGGTHFTIITGAPSVTQVGSNTKVDLPVLQIIKGSFEGSQVGELSQIIRSNGTFTFTLKARFTGTLDSLPIPGTLNVVFEAQGECPNPQDSCFGQPFSGNGVWKPWWPRAFKALWRLDLGEF